MNPQPKDESVSPGKKSKAKLPDFEKTLTNWVKNQQKKGLPITDEDLRKQAQVFSFSRSDQAVVSSASWLEKFKRKNHLVPQKGDPEATLVDSSTTSVAETPVDGSPTSSNGLVSPPMSAIDKNDNESIIKVESTQDFFDFEDQKEAFEHSPSMSQELEEAIDETESGFIPSPVPSEMVCGDPDGIALLDGMDDITGASTRQRSQTYSHAPNIAGSSRPSSAGQKAPSLPVRSLTSTVADARPASVDPRQMMKRHKSVPDIHNPEQVQYSSMQPPPLPRSADASPISNPASPAEEDKNILALHSIKALLEQNPNVAEPDDYLAIGKLMQKMKILRPVPSVLPGGMHPIDIMDSPRISKKRTILGIST